MTAAKYFDAFSLLVTRSHSWTLVVTRGHSWSLVCTFRPDPWSCLVAFSFGKNDFIKCYVAVHLSLSVLLASASTNLSTSSSVRDTNLSRAEFFVVFSGVLLEAIVTC